MKTEKIFASHTSDKGLRSKILIYKEIMQFNRKKAKTNGKMGKRPE